MGNYTFEEEKAGGEEEKAGGRRQKAKREKRQNAEEEKAGGRRQKAEREKRRNAEEEKAGGKKRQNAEEEKAGGRRSSVEDVCEFVRRKFGIEPDEQQRRVLESKAKRGILNCTRQWGKSTIVAAKAVHRAWSKGDQLILVASPTVRQSAEFLRKASGMVAQLGIRPRGDGSNTCSLQLPNGSRIVGLPGREGTVRGFSAVSLLLIDEASRVDDSMYKALRPMLAVSEGEMWIMSTPHGKRGFFYERWAYGGDEWERVRVPATMCERISNEFLERERREMGAMWFQQEYMCEFVDSGMGIFARDVVEEALDDEIIPLARMGVWELREGS